MFPLIPGLTQSGKMSSSDPNSKIDLIESTELIKTKFGKAFCPEKQAENNGVLAFCKYVIFPVITDEGKTFDVVRPEKFGGNISFKNYEELESYYVSGKLHPMDLKNTVIKETDALCAPIREAFSGKEKLISEAYPQK